MIRVLLLNCDRLTSTAVVPLLSSAQDMALLAEIDELCHASKLPTLQPDVIVMGGGERLTGFSKSIRFAAFTRRVA